MAGGRETWDNRVSFLLACIGSTVGLGNIWRFPYLAYESGGGAFLIPFVVMLVFCGLPLLFMELTIGQYTRRGPIGAIGNLCPILQGAGVGTVILTFWFASYYNVIISWTMYYLVASFSNPLPWIGCNNTWNDEFCSSIDGNSTVKNADDDVNLKPLLAARVNGSSEVSGRRSDPSTQQYYNFQVLGQSSGIEEFGSMKLELLGFLVLAWILVYFCIWKSVKATGKVVYFTATLPYLLLIAFLIRGVTLDGAGIGINYFLTPRWELMKQSKVWINAAAQVFNSIGITFGSIIAYSSYNKFHGPILRDTLIVVIVDAITSILCGIIVFSTMGNLALEQGKDIDNVIADGPGLVFVVFPHALAKMPFPQVWSVIFFMTLILLGIDSQFATVEVMVTSLKDGSNSRIMKYLWRHEILVLAVCLVCFVTGLPYIFEGGIYYFHVINYYAAGISLMYIAFFECIAVLWIYGVRRLSANIKDMSGKSPNVFFKICWIAISPLLILAIWIFSMVDYKEPTYNKGKYEYPDWAIALGWCVTMTSLLPIPLMAIVNVYRAKGTGLWNKFLKSLKSTIDQCPCGCDVRLDDQFQAHGNSDLSLIGKCMESSKL